MSGRIVQERVLDVPLSRVYAAWTDPHSLSKWMAPAADMGPADVTLDLRVGGGFEIVMHGEQNFRQTGEYLEIVPGERLVFSWVSHWMPQAEQRTRVTVEFEELAANRTRLRLTHDQLPDSNAYDGHRSGWATIVDRAKKDLEGEA